MLKVASLRYGVIFKKAFSKPDIFTAFVKDMLGIQLEIDHVETEKEFDPPIGQIQSRFDLFAEDKKNRTIVDIQHVRYPDHYHRFLHYHCAAIIEQLASAENYRPDLRVFTIVVLTSGDRHKVDIARIDFDPKDRKGKGLKEIPHQVLYLCPVYVNAETPEPYRQWLLAIQDSLDGEVDENQYPHLAIKQVFHTIERDLISPEERFIMKDEFGYEEIKQEKFQEGEAEGRLEEKIAIAVAMLKKGTDYQFIQEVTGLATEDLAKLLTQTDNRLEAR